MTQLRKTQLREVNIQIGYKIQLKMKANLLSLEIGLTWVLQIVLHFI